MTKRIFHRRNMLMTDSSTLLQAEQTTTYSWCPAERARSAPENQYQIDSSDWPTYQDPQAPRVTPDPIRPKWWGA